MFRSSLVSLLLASVSANAWAAAPAVSAAISTGLFAHRAVYDLELKDASDRSAIELINHATIHGGDARA
ncbi:hypothetical protein ACCT04_34835, partial [Rhizobium ruizarguesonis]